MIRVEFTTNAVEQLTELAFDGADNSVLAELERHIETVAVNPSMAEPAKFPIAFGHMSNIHLPDSQG